MGSLGAWQYMKSSDDNMIAISAIGSIVLGIEDVIIASGVS